MEQNISTKQYYKIILHLYQLKSALKTLVALLEFICGNLIEWQKKVLNI